MIAITHNIMQPSSGAHQLWKPIAFSLFATYKKDLYMGYELGNAHGLITLAARVEHYVYVHFQGLLYIERSLGGGGKGGGGV